MIQIKKERLIGKQGEDNLGRTVIVEDTASQVGGVLTAYFPLYGVRITVKKTILAKWVGLNLNTDEEENLTPAKPTLDELYSKLEADTRNMAEAEKICQLDIKYHMHGDFFYDAMDTNRDPLAYEKPKGIDYWRTHRPTFFCQEELKLIPDQCLGFLLACAHAIYKEPNTSLDVIIKSVSKKYKKEQTRPLDIAIEFLTNLAEKRMELFGW